MDFELAPGRLIGPDHPVFIIAEIGQNHQGNLVKPIYRITYKSMYTHSCSSSISEPIPLLMNSFYLFSVPLVPPTLEIYILDAVGSSGILKGKQKLGVTMPIS